MQILNQKNIFTSEFHDRHVKERDELLGLYYRQDEVLRLNTQLHSICARKLGLILSQFLKCITSILSHEVVRPQLNGFPSK